MTFFDSNWKNYITKIKRQSYLIIGMVSFILFGLVAGGAWYYFYHQESMKNMERVNAEQEISRKVKSINDYYTGILGGASLARFIDSFFEINKSSIPLSLSGFNLENYICDLSKCTFSYKSPDGAVFNVQELNFFNNSYKANISEKGLEYMINSSPFTDETMIERFKSRMDISVARCSELINYIQSFNSINTDGKRKINISGYPSSAVSTIENTLPDVKDKYGFLNMQWSSILPDNIVEVSSFLGRQAYNESFRINKVEKKKSSEVEVSGVLLCAN